MVFFTKEEDKEYKYTCKWVSKQGRKLECNKNGLISVRVDMRLLIDLVDKKLFLKKLPMILELVEVLIKEDEGTGSVRILENVRIEQVEEKEMQRIVDIRNGNGDMYDENGVLKCMKK